MANVNSENLVGKKYKLFNNKTAAVGYSTIKKAYYTDMAAFFITLKENTDSGIILSYKDATDLLNNQDGVVGEEL